MILLWVCEGLHLPCNYVHFLSLDFPLPKMMALTPCISRISRWLKSRISHLPMPHPASADEELCTSSYSSPSNSATKFPIAMPFAPSTLSTACSSSSDLTGTLPFALPPFLPFGFGLAPSSSPPSASALPFFAAAFVFLPGVVLVTPPDGELAPVMLILVRLMEFQRARRLMALA